MSFLIRHGVIGSPSEKNLIFISSNLSSYASTPSFSTSSLNNGDYLEFEFRAVGASQGGSFCRFIGSVSGSGQIHIKGDGLGFEFYWDSGSFSAFSTSNLWDGEWHIFKIEKVGAFVVYSVDGNTITQDASESLSLLSRLRWSSLTSKSACTLSFKNYKQYISGSFIHDLSMNEGSGSVLNDNGTTPQNGSVTGSEGVDYQWS